jgi:hypothetical protein
MYGSATLLQALMKHDLIDAWTPYSTIRFDVIGQQIEHIVDNIHCPWLIEAATTVTIDRVP